MGIELLHNDKINLDSWDCLISNSLNGNFFGLSWYLNIVSPEWEALIEDDYQSIMPLPVKNRWRKKIISMPHFAWQLGIFSNKIMDENLIDQFLNHIPAHYSIKGFNLNKFNRINENNYKFRNLWCIEMDLIQSYDKLRSRYHKDLNENLNSAGARGLSILKGVSLNDFIQLISHSDRYNNKRISAHKLQIIRILASNALRYRLGDIYGAYTGENNLCAAILMMTFRKKTTPFYLAADSAGNQNHALAAIIDEYIKINAEKQQILGMDNPEDKKSLQLFRQFDGELCKINRITGRND